jgi:hypothetical protein
MVVIGCMSSADLAGSATKSMSSLGSIGHETLKLSVIQARGYFFHASRLE